MVVIKTLNLSINIVGLHFLSNLVVINIVPWCGQNNYGNIYIIISNDEKALFSVNSICNLEGLFHQLRKSGRRGRSCRERECRKSQAKWKVSEDIRCCTQGHPSP